MKYNLKIVKKVKVKEFKRKIVSSYDIPELIMFLQRIDEIAEVLNELCLRGLCIKDVENELWKLGEEIHREIEKNIKEYVIKVSRESLDLKIINNSYYCGKCGVHIGENLNSLIEHIENSLDSTHLKAFEKLYPLLEII